MYCEIIPSHKVAVWLLKNIYDVMDKLGLSHDREIEEIIYVAVIVAIALLLGWLVKEIILMAVRKVVAVKRPDIAKLLSQYHVLTRMSAVIPPLVILGLLPFAFSKESGLLTIAERLVIIYSIIVFTLALSSLITLIWSQYDSKRNTKNLPLKGILNSIIGVLWILSAISIFSVAFDKSPAMLLTGLGAFAAALMLVFKDSILGFVAGIQLSQNDMLRVGDWIVVPSTLANGLVIDVSLTAVKVQNWDNTIVTLPPYTLISTSFQNWRGMKESGCRRIARSLLVDVNSIHSIDNAMVDALAEKYPEVKPWVDSTREAREKVFDPGVAVINGTSETNLGLFRAYICAYILNEPQFNHDAQILVRLMDPVDDGIPLQLYCFTATTAWTAYEAIQSSLIEHVVAVASDFGIEIYNTESGQDALSTVTVQMLKDNSDNTNNITTQS